MNSIILEDILSFYYYWFNRIGFFLHFFSCLSINTYGFSQYWQDIFSFALVSTYIQKELEHTTAKALMSEIMEMIENEWFKRIYFSS